MGWPAPMFSKIALIGLIMMLSACVTHLDPLPPEITKVTIPEIGSLETRDIGVPLIEQGTKYTYEALIPKKEIRQYSILRPGYFAFNGDLYAKMGRDGKKWYCGNMVYVASNGEKDPIGERCQNDDLLEKEWNMPKGTYDAKIISRIYNDNYQVTLIYTGRIGDKINVTYREFRNDWARPVLTQDLTFDLSKGRVIGMRGARIEVINATNTSIQYKIISGFFTR
ncbi:hypothetical protein ABNQ38_21640 [Azospirillum sp. A29]|uniref:hypothetical protein n=1 Tax=Azospirillum sp. A29 TaxID=3160606 RepID=UPI00366C296F